MKRCFLLFILIAVLSGCAVVRNTIAVFKRPPGPKLYDNAFIVVKSDNPLLLQKSSDKEFKELKHLVDKDMLRIIHTRLNEFTEDELQSQGDLKVVTECKSRTLRITQDIASISSGSATNVKDGQRLLSDNILVLISTTIDDCESGKRLIKFTNEGDGRDIIAIVKNIASDSVSRAYEYQHGPRQ
jgi:hypothetical protein